MMDDKEISEMARQHNQPPEVPRDRMWAKIDAARTERRGVLQPDFSARRSPAFRIMRLTAAVAAVLILGIFIGRLTRETETLPVGDTSPVAVVADTSSVQETPPANSALRRDSDGPISCSPISRSAPAAATICPKCPTGPAACWCRPGC
jgi:hypothetical protein